MYYCVASEVGVHVLAHRAEPTANTRSPAPCEVAAKEMSDEASEPD